MAQINLPTYEQQEEILEKIENSQGTDLFSGVSFSQTVETTNKTSTLVEMLNISGKGVLTYYTFDGSSGQYVGGLVHLIIDGETIIHSATPNNLSVFERDVFVVFSESLIIKGTVGSTSNSKLVATVHGMLF